MNEGGLYGPFLSSSSMDVKECTLSLSQSATSLMATNLDENANQSSKALMTTSA